MVMVARAMHTRFSNIFHKRRTTKTPADPCRVFPTVGESPVPKASTSPSSIPQSAGKLGPIILFKNTLVFATGIAKNAGVPWVAAVTESIIQIIQRLQSMRVNEEASRDLDNDIKAFLYIVTRNGSRHHDDEIVQDFIRRVQTTLAQMPATQNAFLRFFNADETRGIIADLRQGLNSAVQLFQTGLQISLVDAMDEFKAWRDGIENSNSGNVVKKILNQTYSAKGSFKVRMEGSGNAALTIQDSKFKSEKDFTQYIRAANVTEIHENNTVDVDGDVDLTSIATGATSFGFVY